jgi:simple sugar transport system ATP-binding protein
MTGITKRFGNVVALDAIDLTVEDGTIHAVVGENGAGKTTLMRVLYGALQPDSGELYLDGKKRDFSSSKEAIEAGVGMVSQHYGIIPELTNLQNLILGAEGGALIDVSGVQKRASELAAQMGFDFDWNAEASTLSPAGAQKLEILKLLWRKSEVMILDEPTAMLSPADSDALFDSLRQLVAEGKTVILVTHRLPEVMDHCKRVTVLRGGKKVADREASETSTEELASMIVGGATIQHEAPPSKEPGEVVLAAENLVVRGHRGDEALKKVSIQVRSGEIVGIAGVDGSGQRELFQAIVGTVRPLSGRLLLENQEATRASTSDRLRRGLRVIPEDRHAEAVIESWSLTDNSAFGLQRTEALSNGPLVDTAARAQWAQRVADKFQTRHGGLGLPMKSLSGGNQQRFVAARALEMDPRLILGFQPARGLDLLGTAEVYRAIRERCDQGAAALVVSFDLDELLEHCDRIVAMNGGRIYEPPASQQKDRDAIGRLMVGAG